MDRDSRKFSRSLFLPSPSTDMNCRSGNKLVCDCYAAIVSLGYSPGLGFIHTGKQLSFVYDVADLYKAETTIPAAFEAIQKMKQGEPQKKRIRLTCRAYFANARILSRIAQDLEWIFQETVEEEMVNGPTVGSLWDDRQDTINGGKNYAAERDLL